ncbi:MAG: bvgA [Marmoricola sp.]|nr:bvgA [Marmoricola sp.]
MSAVWADTGTENSGAPSDGAEAAVARPPRRSVKVVLLSDQHLVRETVRVALLSRGFEVYGVHFPVGPTEVREIANLTMKLQVNGGLVLAELNDPVARRDVLRLMQFAPTRWLLLTCGAADAHWGAAVEAGAVGVLPMTTSLDQLDAAVQALAAGRPVMDPALRADVLNEWIEVGQRHQELTARVEALTPRELAVLGALNDGQTVRTIAEERGVSEGTVRSQVKSILRKLHVTSQLAGVATYREVTSQNIPPRNRPLDR